MITVPHLHCDYGMVVHTAGVCSKKTCGVSLGLTVGFSGSGLGSFSKFSEIGQNNGKIRGVRFPSRLLFRKPQIFKHFMVPSDRAAVHAQRTDAQQKEFYMWVMFKILSWVS